MAWEVVCLVAKLNLFYDAQSATYTAISSYDGNPTPPLSYAWTLPPDATNVNYQGGGQDVTANPSLATSVTFKSASGGDVSVTITDSDTPDPCEDTATVATSAATQNEPIELGGHPPAIAPAGETSTHKQFELTEDYSSTYAAINLQLFGAPNAGEAQNALDKRRVSASNALIQGQDFEQVFDYNVLDYTDDQPLVKPFELPKYATETRWEFACRGSYIIHPEGGGPDQAGDAYNPRGGNSNGNSPLYSNSTFITIAGEEGAPVDPIDPPPTACPDGTHDDGTGNCVPDEPTGPQPCAAGYHDDGTGKCIPDPVDPTEPKSCAANFHDNGEGVCVPDPTDPSEPPTCATGKYWNGVACVPEPTDPGEPKTCADGFRLYAGACVPDVPEACPALFTRWICVDDVCTQIQTTDAAIGYATQAACEADCGGETGPPEPPIDPTLAAPAAPVVTRDCESGALVVTAPAFPMPRHLAAERARVEIARSTLTYPLQPHRSRSIQRNARLIRLPLSARARPRLT